MDDMEKAAEELASGALKEFPLLSRSVGVLFCDFEMDHGALLAALGKKLPIDIVGCTTVASLEGKNGFLEMSAMLMVMTADDVQFVVALSDPFTPENVREEIEKTYRRGVEALAQPVKLALAFPAYNLDITLDEYPETLGEIVEDVPLFGGLPASGSGSGVNGILAGGRVHTDRLVFVLMGGNVRPLFSVRNVLSDQTEQKRPVTRADRNTVYSVGDVSFVEYLRRFGLPVEKMAAEPGSTSFVTNPLVVEMAESRQDDGIPYVRTLHKIDLENGSGTAIGKIPEGAVISVAVMKRRDVEVSTHEALLHLLGQIEAGGEDYEYSTILCVSCIGRYMVMGSERDGEGRAISRAVPKGLNLSGFYGYGELCPTSVRNGRVLNRAHNESIVFCAL
jgi:hypothetical protein